MVNTAGRVLDALVDGGEVIKRADKTGRVWYSLASQEEQATLAPSGAKAKRAKEVPLPAGWKVGDALRAWAMAQPGMTAPLLDAYEAYFVDYAASGKKVYADWDAAFRNCVRGDWGGIKRNFKPGAVASAMPGVIW